MHKFGRSCFSRLEDFEDVNVPSTMQCHVKEKFRRYYATVVHRHELSPLVVSKFLPDCAAIFPTIPNAHLQKAKAEGGRLAPHKRRIDFVLHLPSDMGMIYTNLG